MFVARKTLWPMRQRTLRLIPDEIIVKCQYAI